MIEAMKGKQSLKAAELQDGDIVCFQLADKIQDSRSSETVQESITHLTHQLTLTDDNRSDPLDSNSVRLNIERIDDARLFYDFIHYRKKVDFGPHPNRNANPEQLEQFSLILNSKYSYDQVAAKVAEQLGVDPTHLRLWTVNGTSNLPKTAVKRTPSQTLQTILTPSYTAYTNAQRQDALFYEILEISLSELDTKKSMKVVWVSEGTTKEVSTNSQLFFML